MPEYKQINGRAAIDLPLLKVSPNAVFTPAANRLKLL